MTLVNQANNITGTINDHRKQIPDVASQRTDVEGRNISDGGKRAPELGPGASLIEKLKPGFDVE
jgi:hypothetical protein